MASRSTNIPAVPSPVGPRSFDVVVVGAGAAGMMCAATAGRRGRRVVLVDHAARLAEKIRISGGGRCNFTNLHCRPENFISRNPHFCRSALARFGPREFVALVERHGIPWHEKKLGQLFCDESSARIVDMLRRECDDAGVEWLMPASVTSVAAGGNGFVVATDRGCIDSTSLVIATGGLSIPKIGASPFGYRVAEQFGLAVVPPRPGLVPLVFDASEVERWGDLAGVSVDAAVTCGSGRFRESLLFTHRGLSGPSILQISSYWSAGLAVHVDLLPDRDAASLLAAHRRSRELVANVLSQWLPRRLAQHRCAALDAGGPMTETSDRTLRALSDGLRDWQVRPSGTAGYQKAEVTLGGVDTDALSSKTMEARSVRGLYFIGEVVDVTGHLGGFNFQWAWSSGVAAGEAA